MANLLCGPKRPGHFHGVITVVKRLFDIMLPDSAYFGQKDYQQARIIEEMIKRFRLPVRMVICPIIREKDGLAMSSRNVYLKPDERTLASAIFKSLQLGKRLIQKGVRDAKGVEKEISRFLRPFVDKIDYVKVVNAHSLCSQSRLKGKIVIAIACFIGKTRLIDNILI